MARILLLLATLGTAGACTPSRDDGLVPGFHPPATCSAVTCAQNCRREGHANGTCRGTACVCGGVEGATELCGDAFDNDGDLRVDEDCGCRPGVTQPCWSGPAEARDRGTCRDGVQSCVGSGEFGEWSACEGEALPGTETCNGADDDCDLFVDEGCPGACVPTEFGRETDCGDGVDNDCDDATDCRDPDCPPCCDGEELCDNGLDDDCDGEIDEDCPGPCTVLEFGRCLDGEDNDCDGRLDCDDPECALWCCSAEDCGNGLDDDCDGTVDCEDTNCCTLPACGGSPVCGTVCCVPGAVRWCDTPTYCSWGVQECRPDGRWGSCEETADRPGGCSGYYYDPECCVGVDACCQNYGYDADLPWDASVGDCSGITAAC